jgi:hypothetical protein
MVALLFAYCILFLVLIVAAIVLGIMVHNDNKATNERRERSLLWRRDRKGRWY